MAECYTTRMVLHGRVLRDGDQFMSHCHELNIATAGTTVGEALDRTPDMIRAFLVAAEKKGVLADVLRRISPEASVTTAAGLSFHTHFTIEGEVSVQ